MPDLDNFELNSPSPESSYEPPLPPADDGQRRRRIIVIVAILALLVLVIAGWMWSRRSRSLPIVHTVEETPPPAPDASVEEVEEDAEPVELPDLDASDLAVRELAATLSANPDFAAWLVNEDLVRRFVVAVDNIAEGETPRVHLGFMAPKGSFRTAQREDQLVVSPASYRRYDGITEAFISLDTEGSIELFRRFEPLAQAAYQDLGYPQGRFEDVVRRAAQIVLETPRASGSVELEAAVRSYRFADPSLERLDPVQKQLLRFGPENLTKIQAKVRTLIQELDRSGR